MKPYSMRLILNGRIKTYSFRNTNAPPVFLVTLFMHPLHFQALKKSSVSPL